MEALNEGKTSPSFAFTSFYAPHVGCQDSVRAGFWQTVLGFVDDVLRALVAVPLVIAGNSNVWFPGLINSHPPGNADRSCLELFRPILDAFNLEIQDPAAVPTHRHGADLDLIFASPVVAHHVEVHNGTYCPCEDRRTCCPLLGSDHFALPKQANIIKCKPLPSVHIDRAAASDSVLEHSSAASTA